MWQSVVGFKSLLRFNHYLQILKICIMKIINIVNFFKLDTPYLSSNLNPYLYTPSFFLKNKNKTSISSKYIKQLYLIKKY